MCKVKRYFAALVCAFALVGCQKSEHQCESAQAPTADIAVIGDSYTGGSSEGGLRDKGWPILVEAQLRCKGTPIVADLGTAGGSGYVNRGPRNIVFGEEIPDTVDPGTRLVVLFGSINDRGVDPQQYSAAVKRTLNSIQATAPSARILVIGPPWVAGDAPASITHMRDLLREQAEAAHARFVDPIADQWFVGRRDLIGKDGEHPTDAGHVYMADLIAPIISEELGNAH
ncbi:MAG: SGNH/GDSL hydrolase family protein [Actinomycetota bacterium]